MGVAVAAPEASIVLEMEPDPGPRRNFLLMSICFSAIHGMFTTPFAYATTLLGSHGGSIANGTLHVTNALGSLLIAVRTVQALGLKGGLLLCMGLYTLYIGFFAVAVYSESKLDGDADWYYAIPSSVCGGLALAVGWTAQGGYFSRSATRVAAAEGRPRDVVNVELAGTFAVCYLIFEVASKVGFSLLQELHVGANAIFAAYFVACAVVTGAVAPHIDRIEMSASMADRSCAEKLLDTVYLWRDVRLWLLAPTNLAFGFGAAYMNGYINSLVAKDLGVGTVGFSSSVSVFVSALLAPLCGRLSLYAGKGAVLGLGGLSFFCVPLVAWAAGAVERGSVATLAICYVLQGSGRAVYESTNKAIISEVFQRGTTESAFANSFVELSVSASLCFFLANVASSMRWPSLLLMALAGLMLPSYQAAQRIDKFGAWRERAHAPGDSPPTQSEGLIESTHLSASFSSSGA